MAAGEDIDGVRSEEREAASLARAEELSDIRSALATERGRRLFARILARCGLLDMRWHCDNARMTDLHAGERAIGVWLFDEARQADGETALVLLRKTKQPEKTA